MFFGLPQLRGFLCRSRRLWQGWECEQETSIELRALRRKEKSQKLDEGVPRASDHDLGECC